MKYYFRCKENPKAPLIVTDERWEAEDFAKHPDYQRVDAQGRDLQSAGEAFDNVGLAKVAAPVEPVEPQLTETPEDLY